jgi:FkbM family methyltransferase
MLAQFEPDLINVLYDADPECLPQVAARNVPLPSRLHVFPHCLAGSAGVRAFNLNFDPFTSSLLDPNPAFAGYYQFAMGTDYLMGEAMKARERRTVQTVTLDEIFQDGVLPAPPPDFLSLDTQGTELEILSGAERTLAAHVLGVVMEVEFAPLYLGQPLFGEVAAFMAGRGFEFCRFLTMHELHPYRSPIGRRGVGVHAYADALFLRKPESVLAGPKPSHPSLMLKKLAFIAIVYGLTDIALACIRLDPDPSFPEAPPAYLRFLEAWAGLASDPGEFPPTFAEKFSFDRSKGRFAVDADDSADQRVEETAALLCRHLKQAPPAFSCLETLMRDHGLTAQAEVVWERRVSQSLFVSSLHRGVLAPLGDWGGVVADFLKAWLLEDAGHPDAALEEMRLAAAACTRLPALGIEPDVLGYLYAMGGILQHRKAFAPAQAMFQWILRNWDAGDRFPGRTGGCCFHLGEMALTEGDPGKAAEWFQRCLERVPDHRQGRLHLTRLQAIRNPPC